jgi:hypothetical protein
MGEGAMTLDNITDRELLELAAKAAGYVTKVESGIVFVRRYRIPKIDWKEWNPLDDDGDALRLAVKLEINLSFSQDCAFGFWIGTPKDGEDLSSHARRAIVHVAAEIGRNMT